jgi:hypothetical protein
MASNSVPKKRRKSAAVSDLTRERRGLRLMATASARVGLALCSAPEPHAIDLSNVSSFKDRSLAVRS